ncbi:MAG: metalloregulator ArsR/SmtB family transcription factor [Synechococcales bacterium]|nr:metalloregulator ArsR/SmtB family transcription factor [Synechococcales bacterium]
MTVSPLVPQTYLVQGFHALSDPIRLQVLALLQQGELCVCDLCAAIDVSQSKLSFHLKVLKEAQLVQIRQEGRWVYYRLNPTQFAALVQFLTTFSQASPQPSARTCSL